MIDGEAQRRIEKVLEPIHDQLRVAMMGFMTELEEFQVWFDAEHPTPPKRSPLQRFVGKWRSA